MSHTGAATLALCGALIVGIAGCADAPEHIRPTAGGMACNGPCRWWMSLGAKPEDGAPPAAARRPAKPVGFGGAVPMRAAVVAPRPRADRTVRTSRWPGARARVPSPTAAAPVEAPETRPSGTRPAGGGWGMPIPGSDPVRPESWGPLR